MSTGILVSAVACAGHLAFALLVWLRRDQGKLALPLALLFLDTFAWTLSDLAFRVTRDPVFHHIDHVFSSFLPVLTLHVIAGFVGRVRALGGWLRGLYGVSVGVALLAATGWWWQVLLVHGLSCTAWCALLLLRHRRQSLEPDERARTVLLLVALVVGTLLASTDLWVDDLPVLPKLSNLGMLLTLGLVALCVLRLRLLGRDVPVLVAGYALLSGCFVMLACLVLLHSLPPRGALLAIFALSALAIGLLALSELRRARAAAGERVEKLVALGRFSEQLSHDLRNPLAALKGAIQFLLVEREQGRSLDQQAPFLNLMLEQVERANRVVEAYQRIANVEAVKQSTSLNDLIEEVLTMQRFASTGDIKVSAQLDPGLPSCELDRELVTTTLENLLRNAFEAMPEGGAITVATRQVKSDGGVQGVLMSVKDEGQGMDARVLERATDQFFTTKATGSGLGLSFAERVARAHHGRLELSSEVGRGTIVQLWMPLRPVC